MKTDIIIIIVTYNALNWLESCLDSTGSYKVIIIDNNSNDGTVEYIKNEYPNIELHPQEKNLGFGKANNIGINKALKMGANHIFLLNQDAYLIENCLSILIDLQKKNPRYGILSPIHITSNQNKLDSNFANYISFQNNPNLISDYILNNNKKSIYKVPYINAAGWLISRECIEIVGFFDPMFFHYGEDDNFCQRVEYHNLKVGIVPNSFMIHDRENRKTNSIVPHSNDFLVYKERYYKLTKGNINSQFMGFKKEKSRLLKYIIKFLFSLKLNLARYYYLELKMINRIQDEILESRKRNESPRNIF